jgi:hypothetical protein
MKTAIIETPAKERVIAALERYKQTDADLQDYRATSSKAEVEEQKGLDDPKANGARGRGQDLACSES